MHSLKYATTILLLLLGACALSGCIVHTSNGDVDCQAQVVQNMLITVCAPVR